MDGSHYSPNVINTPTSYSTSESPTPQSLQPSSLPPHTLPPLQQNLPVMQSQAYSYAHAPRTPATPNTPGSATSNSMGSYPPPPSNNGGRGSYQMMPNTSYPPPHQTYTSSALMPQTTGAMSHPQPIAPAPSPGARPPPVLRPMPPAMPQAAMGGPYGVPPLMPQPSMLADGGDQPTHVVGSQGRRGILPSAPGRPAAPAAGTAQKAMLPQKDADGKFPCAHCNKTYLHAKHLKRHLLRHTGDRPYMCVLCRDTFSRSDILKRHFQKCSIRRGNPQGVSHLSHPHAHVKKSQQAAAQQKPMGEGGDLNHMNGMGNPMSGDGMPFGLVTSTDGGMSSMANSQSQLSRSSSINRLEDAGERERQSVSGPVMNAPSRGVNFEQSYNGNVSASMNPNINPQLANYSLPPSQNGMPMYAGQNTNQQQSNIDWALFPPGAQDTYVGAFPPNVGQNQIGTTHREPNAETTTAAATSDGGVVVPVVPVPVHVPGSGLTSLDGGQSLFSGSTNWGPPGSRDPYQQLSTQILNFFFPPDHVLASPSPAMSLYFSPDNTKDFLDKYTHFHVHFSILHIPTFRIFEAYTGLLAGMCCIGACYSDRVAPDNVREMMTYLKAALERDSRMMTPLTDGGAQLDIKYEDGSFARTTRDVEELQAIMLMHTLLIWNGTPAQRDDARRVSPLVASLVRKAGLLTVSSDPSILYSPLHQPDFLPANFNAATFDWLSWVEQEKRNRLMFTIFAADSALGLYFNQPPLFDAFEVQLPLPVDDAAWEAADPTECAEALGLHGPQAAQHRNPDGTQRAKQPEMHLALQALLHSSYQIQTGTTNLYGKFILIHALLAMIRKAQLDGLAAIMNGASTPLAKNDWIVGGGQDVMSTHGSANNSGRATPVDGAIPPQALKALITALDKFKRNWDLDMANQFPPSSTSPRRHGFSKDGVHYYWLANYMLKNTRPADLNMEPDQRFMQVIHLLKSVKSWVEADGASRGEELGSIGEIDRDYGALNLTLDMVNLFTPVPKAVASPGVGAVTA